MILPVFVLLLLFVFFHQRVDILLDCSLTLKREECHPVTEFHCLMKRPVEAELMDDTAEEGISGSVDRGDVRIADDRDFPDRFSTADDDWFLSVAEDDVLTSKGEQIQSELGRLFFDVEEVLSF